VPRSPRPHLSQHPKSPRNRLSRLHRGLSVGTSTHSPSPSGTEDGYTLEEMEGAVERHRRGLIISSVFFGVGVGALAGSIAWGPHAECGDDDTWFCIPPGPMFVGTFGGAMAIGGLVGMALKGTRLNKSRSELRKLKEARYERPPRVQWDLAQSRLVF